MDDEEFVKTNAAELGIEEKIASLHEAYEKSCDLRGENFNDFEYFKEYTFMLLALCLDRIEVLENQVHSLTLRS